MHPHNRNQGVQEPSRETTTTNTQPAFQQAPHRQDTQPAADTINQLALRVQQIQLQQEQLRTQTLQMKQQQHGNPQESLATPYRDRAEQLRNPVTNFNNRNIPEESLDTLKKTKEDISDQSTLNEVHHGPGVLAGQQRHHIHQPEGHPPSMFTEHRRTHTLTMMK